MTHSRSSQRKTESSRLLGRSVAMMSRCLEKPYEKARLCFCGKLILRDLALARFGKTQGVEKIVIEGAKRTTGKGNQKGAVPRVWEVMVK